MMGTAHFGRWLTHFGKAALPSTVENDAAERGNPESQFNVGRQFAVGNGVAQDYARAVEWYLKAANQGHSLAQFNLWLVYGQGQGMLRDPVKAMMWLHKAADLGNARAQYQLGVRLYRDSKGVRKAEAAECRVEALKWLQLATAQGYRDSESALEFVALEMTREEVHEGGRRAGAFAGVPGNPLSETLRGCLHWKPFADDLKPDGRELSGKAVAQTKESIMNNKVFVGNLASTTSEKEIRNLFSPHGTITELQHPYDRDTGRRRSFAFVTMATPEAAGAAILALNGSEMGNRTLTVTEARPREEREQRL